MRIIILLILALLTSHQVFSQMPKAKATISKNDIQSEMGEAINRVKTKKADLEKQLKTETDPETIKDLKEQIAVMQKQLLMMQGLNRNVSMMSDKVVKEVVADDGSAIAPKRDITRIGMLPKSVLTEQQLLLFIQNIQSGVEKLIPAAEKAEALKIYNETKAQYKSTAVVANAANGLWILGHWEKALFIMGKSCMDDMNDADNLNNYAAFLIMTGGEQAALPILEYLDERYPGNTTILNNIGQAWYGLGDNEQAKKYLDKTKLLYPNHSMANNTLASIYESEGDTKKAISFLLASLKENYDPEKEAQLRRLGYEIKFADMPPLNYPMKKDPFGFIPLINSWDPNKIQSSIADGDGALGLKRYITGVKKFDEDLGKEDAELQKHLSERAKRIAMDKPFSQQLLEPFNCPAYLLAGRSLELYCFEKGGLCLKQPELSSLMTALWLPLPKPYMDDAMFEPVTNLIADCEKVWVKEVMEPLALLDKALITSSQNQNCHDADAKLDAFLAKRKEIYSNGVNKIQAEFQKQSPAVTNYIKYAMYAGIDEEDLPATTSGDFLLNNMWLFGEIDRRFNRKRIRNKYYSFINSLLLKGERFEHRYRSNCDLNTPPPEPEETGDILAPLKARTLECEYIKKVITPVRYTFVLHCNNITEETDPELPKKKPDIPKGSAHNASRRNSSTGPVTSGRGPYIKINLPDEEDFSLQRGPLSSEYKLNSQFSLEYNKWGNLVGFNFQLSEDGTTLKDPESLESGVDSRWSWNAMASPKKSYLNKLVIK